MYHIHFDTFLARTKLNLWKRSHYSNKLELISMMRILRLLSGINDYCSGINTTYNHYYTYNTQSNSVIAMKRSWKPVMHMQIVMVTGLVNCLLRSYFQSHLCGAPCRGWRTAGFHNLWLRVCFMKSLYINVWRSKDVGGPAHINFRRKGAIVLSQSLTSSAENRWRES